MICQSLSLRLRQIIFMLATDKSRYFAQPRPIIANYLILQRPWQTRTHCSRFPVCPRAQHLLLTQFCVRDTKNVSDFVEWKSSYITMSNNPLDFVSGIIQQYSLRLRRIIVNYQVIKIPLISLITLPANLQLQ